jgi:hypothetical protein
LLIAIAPAVAFMCSGSAAQEPSGNTVGVIPAASAAGVTGQRVLAVDDPIFMGDQVNTDGMGEVQIRFRDNTRIVVGPNSLMTIDRFVFNPDNTARDVGINYVRGTFRFLSGFSNSEAYSFRTPTMTIGVRGSGHDVNATEGEFVLTEGVARLCHNITRECVDLTEPCSVAVVDEDGIRVVESETERVARLQSGMLQYISGDQSALDPDFQVPDIEQLCGIVVTQQSTGQDAAFAAATGGTIIPGVIGAAALTASNEEPLSP